VPSHVLELIRLVCAVATTGTCCIGFRPSEIAAAVAAAVVIEGNVAGIENACAHVDKVH
jgi:cyclin D1/2/4